MNQKQLVLKYLHDFGSITPMQAFGDLGITKLATVISYMRRKEGIKFEKEMVSSVNRYGNPVRFAKYKLREEETNE